VQSCRALFAVLALAVVAGCRDATSPPKPASMKIIAGNGQTAAAGKTLATPPTFIVYDDNGRAIDGVSVTINVTAGNGILSGAPTKTRAGETSVGTWSLGPRVGPNQLTITVPGLPPQIVNATAVAGAAAKIVPSTIGTITGRVAKPIMTPLSARVTDAFGNGVASASVSLSVTGGGNAPSSLTTDADGNVTIDHWIAGTIAGQSVLTLTSGSATVSFIANVAAGDPAQILIVSGDQQHALAGVSISPAVVRVVDRFGNGVPSQSVALSVTSGAGSVSDTIATSASDGTVTLPTWTLGRSALPQTLHVGVGTIGADVSAAVQTDYNIDVRFFGADPTDAQKALFTNAAARISAIVTGDIPDVNLTNFSATASCGLAGLPVVNETVDDLLIFAAVQNIDGPGGILAEAGPCLFRNATSGNFAVVGVMLLDAADIESATSRGMLQDIITHEMLHIVGIGTLWDVKNLIAAAGTPSVAYYGLTGRQGCLDSGGAGVCGSSVPVENNGVPGTADSHWRESTFQSELMTGYVNLGGMPLSAITVGSLADMGYTVNALAADPFRVPGTPSANTIPSTGQGWEKPLGSPGMMLQPDGTATKIKRP
jgi:hypothetical protein